MVPWTRRKVRGATYVAVLVPVLAVALILGADFSLAALIAIICGLIVGEALGGTSADVTLVCRCGCRVKPIYPTASDQPDTV
jgi:hypothetical protein